MSDLPELDLKWYLGNVSGFFNVNPHIFSSFPPKLLQQLSQLLGDYDYFNPLAKMQHNIAVINETIDELHQTMNQAESNVSFYNSSTNVFDSQINGCLNSLDQMHKYLVDAIENKQYDV